MLTGRLSSAPLKSASKVPPEKRGITLLSTLPGQKETAPSTLMHVARHACAARDMTFALLKECKGQHNTPHTARVGIWASDRESLAFMPPRSCTSAVFILAETQTERGLPRQCPWGSLGLEPA